MNLPVISFTDSPYLNIQKCLVPSSYEIKAGTWMKCVLGDSISFVVCRIFHRDTLSNCCQLAHNVGTVEDLNGQVLTKLERLKIWRYSSPAKVDVSIEITEEFFLKGTDTAHLEVLKDRLGHHGLLDSLRVFHLMVGCSVRTPDLKKAGISTIHILACAEAECNEDFVFRMDESTEICIVNAHFVSPISKGRCSPPFFTYGFERSWCDLEDVLAIAKIQDIQKSHKNRIRLPLNVLLVGPSGCGKSSFIEYFVAEKKCNLFRITKAGTTAQYQSESISSITKVFRAAEQFYLMKITNSPIVILLEDLDLLCPQVGANSGGSVYSSVHSSAALLELVDHLHEMGMNIICLATTSAPEKICATARRPTRFIRETVINPPTVTDRKRMFEAIFKSSTITSDLKKMLLPKLLNFVSKRTQGYVAADLALLVRNIEQTLLRQQGGDIDGRVNNIIGKMKPTSIRATDVSVYETEQGFSFIGGLKALKQNLEVSILAGLKHQSAFQRFGLNLPKGVLLYGPPGCGKTTIAKCLAKEANMRFISTSAAEVYSPYVGCAEKFITKMFDTARNNAPCLIFLDEIDTLAGRRVLQSNGSSDVQMRILSTLLTEMDGIVGASCAIDSGKYILVVAASNRPDMIDDALLRPGRFDKLIYVPEPDLESRSSILQLYAQRMPFASDVNFGEIVERTATFSGADMCNLCNEAAMRAFQRDMNTTEIYAEDFDYALQQQKSSLCHGQIRMYMEFQKNSAAK